MISFERVFMTILCIFMICLQIVELIQLDGKDWSDNLSLIFFSLTIISYVVRATSK